MTMMMSQALLACRVTALQDQLVSWFSIALPDLSLSLLTVGFQTYSADTRFVNLINNVRDNNDNNDQVQPRLSTSKQLQTQDIRGQELRQGQQKLF